MGSIINKNDADKYTMENKESSNVVISDLEKRGEDSAKEILNSNLSCEQAQSSLLQIITDGAKEYEKRTGQKMSYAEMRAAYG